MKDYILNHKKLVIGIAIALVAIIGIGVALIAANSGSSKDAGNDSYTVTYGNVDSTVTGKGHIQAGREIKITAPVGVIVEDVLVKNGDSVNAGQPLANIETASILTKLSEAISNEAQIQGALDAGNLTSDQRDALEGQRTLVRSYIDQLRDLRDYPVITSPQNGIINNVYLIDGQPITTQNALLQSGSSSASNSSSNTNVSLVVPKIDSKTKMNENSKNRINLLPFIQLGYLLNSQSFYFFDSLNLEDNLITKVNQFNNSINDGIITVSDGETTETYEEIIEYQYDDTYVNGRPGYVPDTSSSNIEEYVITQSPESSLSGSPSTSNQNSRANNIVQTIAEATSYDAVAFNLGSMDELSVNVEIDERDILDLAQGQPATIKLEALPDETFNGSIKSISSSTQPSDGNSKYSVEVTLSTDKNLKSGMTANVSIATGSNQNVLVIPVSALQDSAGKKFVYTKENDDGTLGGEVEVTTGLANKDFVAITSGLKNGQVIYYPKSDLANSFTQEVQNEVTDTDSGDSQ